MTTQQTHTMRKFLNDPADVVHEYLTGLAAAHPDLLRYDPKERILVRVDAPVSGKVALVSGGGSGCEPLHSGFVGPGMLDATCQGQIFSSPVPDQIVAATEAVHAGAGVLQVIKNFPGEVMNFEMAAELASYEDITVQSVIVNDDVAVAHGPGSAGRRGLGATVLVEKIAGAAAERGGDLQAVAEVGRKVNDRTRTYGVGLSSCTPPLAGRPIFELPEGQMELGIGISGEPGRRREAIRSARDIAALLIDEVLADRRPPTGAPVLVLVNGMGGTPQIELYLLYGEIERGLRAAGLAPARALVGSFVTSLEQAGAALTVLELDDELTALWDEPVRTTALRWGM
jgi:phosphoenolpyruvate---glycerone phosphotransferase subunit DhaK